MDTWGYDVVFENCLFYNNSAKYGGAIISYRYVTVINNCTFAKNTSVSGTGGIDLFNFGYSPHFADITNSVFYCNDSDDFYILDEATIPDINNCA
jgi:predicted outer membrane repeat protein